MNMIIDLKIQPVLKNICSISKYRCIAILFRTFETHSWWFRFCNHNHHFYYYQSLSIVFYKLFIYRPVFSVLYTAEEEITPLTFSLSWQNNCKRFSLLWQSNCKRFPLLWLNDRERWGYNLTVRNMKIIKTNSEKVNRRIW